ncbi:MAG: DUF4169 family protein [Rhodospirillales bacterium]
MSADIVNLRKARKAKQRAEKESAADANRLRYGRTAEERKKTDADRERDRSHIDGHRLDDTDPEG